MPKDYRHKDFRKPRYKPEHSMGDHTLLVLCKEGWANESQTDGITTTWRISITSRDVDEIAKNFSDLDVFPVGHFIVTHDSDKDWGVVRFASPEGLLRAWA